MTVEQELRALRNFYDMTLPELADKSGVSVNTIRKGKSERVKLDMMELIAEASGKKIKVILE